MERPIGRIKRAAGNLRRINGPLLVLVLIAGYEGGRLGLGQRASFAALTAVLGLAVVYSGYRGGISDGLFSSALALLYAGIRLADPGGLSRPDYSPDEIETLRVLAASFTGTGLLVGLMKASNDRQTEALAETERRYRHIFENSAVGIFQITPRRKLLAANAKLAEITGFSSTAEIVSYLDSNGPSLTVDRGREMLRQLTEKGSIVGYETQINRPDGRRAWLSINARTVKDQQGETQYYEGTVEDITDRKQVELELRREKEFTGHLIDSSINGVVAYDRELRYTAWNPAMTEMTGKTREEVIGRPVYEVFPFLEKLGVVDQIRAALSGQQTFTGTVQFNIDETGKSGFAEAYYGPIYGLGGEIIGVIGVVHDVSRRKQAEEELLRQNRYLAALHGVSIDLMNRRDTTDLLTSILDRASELLAVPHGFVYLVEPDGQQMRMRIGLGYCAEHVGATITRDQGMAGKVWQSGSPMVVEDYDSWPERLPQFGQGWKASIGAPLLSGMEVVGVIGLIQSESERRFEAEHIQLLSRFAEQASLALDNARLLEAAGREIGRRIKTEEVVRQSEEKFRALSHTASDAIISFSYEGELSYLNPAAERMFGYRLKEAAGRGLNILFPERYYHPDAEGLSRFIPSQESQSRSGAIELTARAKDGREFPVELTVASWELERGRGTFFTSIIRDITERKRIEQMKQDFVSVVSHQLKTPVALVRGYVENLLTGVTGELNDRQRQYLADIQDITERNYSLITDLLNLSRLQRGVISFLPRPIKLGELVEKSVQPYLHRIERKKLKLEVRGDLDAAVLTDIFKTTEALRNVIDNAVKFTRRGRLTIDWAAADGFGRVTVADTGPGISPETKSQLFERVQVLGTEAEPLSGSRLGLYIAHEFISRQGGRIEVASEPGKGSEFTFFLPLAKVKTKTPSA